MSKCGNEKLEIVLEEELLTQLGCTLLARFYPLEWVTWTDDLAPNTQNAGLGTGVTLVCPLCLGTKASSLRIPRAEHRSPILSAQKSKMYYRTYL